MSPRTKFLLILYVPTIALFLSILGYETLREKTLRKEILSLKEQSGLISNSLMSTRSLLDSIIEGNESLKQRLDEESQKISKAEQSTINLNKEMSAQKERAAASDITNIIKEWSPKIARLTCMFRGTNGESSTEITISGSSVATFADNKFLIMTNKHVVSRKSGEILDKCDVDFPEENIKLTTTRESVNVSALEDIAFIEAVPDQKFSKNTLLPIKKCSVPPNLGDEVIILGFPSVGSVKTITATNGIISGFDREYYITSAKIEQGNSGGAAILVKDNCFIGIPTLVLRGKLESFARILPVK